MTTPANVDSNPNVYSPPMTSELRRLRTLVNQASALLDNQQKILQRFGVDFPTSGPMQNLKTIESGLDRLMERANSDQIELVQLRALAETATLMNSSLDLDAVLTQAMDEVIRLTGAERGYILLKNPADEGGLEFRIMRSREHDMNDTNFQISQSIVREVMSSGEPLLTDNASNDPRTQDRESVALFVLRSIVCVPLKHKDKLIGAVYVANRLLAGVFGARELKLLTSFAAQAAVAIENARLFHRVQTELDSTRQEVKRLRIEVDFPRRDQEVRDITNSPYFEQLTALVRDQQRRRTSP